MNKKRIGVITFHNYDNYGAILQSYALQKKLRELGTYPEIIDYSCQYISNPFRLVNLKEKGLFNYIYGAIGHICYIPRRRKCNQFRKHMKYSEPVTKGNMQAVSGKYHIFWTFLKKVKRNAAMRPVSANTSRRNSSAMITAVC